MSTTYIERSNNRMNRMKALSEARKIMVDMIKRGAAEYHFPDSDINELLYATEKAYQEKRMSYFLEDRLIKLNFRLGKTIHMSSKILKQQV